jgi:hypothetical protein
MSNSEANGRRYGVLADTVHGRTWQTGVLIPEITYDSPGTPLKVEPPDIPVYEPGAQGMRREIIFEIQQALAARGFDPGEIDGDYGPDTQAAVRDFQTAVGLLVDGAVGPETSEALGISLMSEEGGPVQVGNGGDGLGSNPLLLALLGSMGKAVGRGTHRTQPEHRLSSAAAAAAAAGDAGRAADPAGGALA